MEIINQPLFQLNNLIKIHELIIPVVLLFFEESGLPLPLPGDAVIAYVGFKVSQKAFPYFEVFVLFLFSVLCGSSLLYFLSRKWGNKIILKVGRYLHLNKEKFFLLQDKFKKYGILVIIVGRHIPGFRIPVTVFSGISKVRYPIFLFSVLISIIPWIYFYLFLGSKLGYKTISILNFSYWYYIYAGIPLLVIILGVIYLRVKK